jgi:riboflavin kinase/FMN adenylyltransferase
MKVINGLENIAHPFKNPVLTIGNFDGVHLGHQQIFQHVIIRAKELDGEAIVMTFQPVELGEKLGAVMDNTASV